MWIENRPRGHMVVLEPQPGHFLAMWLCRLSGGPEASTSVTGSAGAAWGPLGGNGCQGLSHRPDAAPFILRGLPVLSRTLAAKGWAPGVLMQLGFPQTTSSTLKGAIQLGIGYTVGNLSSKPERDVLMQDFYVVESIFFPRYPARAAPNPLYSPCMHTPPPCYSFSLFLCWKWLRPFLGSPCL